MLTALLLLAEVTAQVPPAAPPPTPDTVTEETCADAERQSADTRTITICAQRPRGYRLDPDVMAAKRIKRTGRGAAPRPREDLKQDNCATVGPMGCRGQGVIDLASAALAAVQMATRAAQGENIGRMFQIDKQLTEYELYLQAKADREAREEEAAAARIRAEARAKDQPPKP